MTYRRRAPSGDGDAVVWFVSFLDSIGGDSGPNTMLRVWLKHMSLLPLNSIEPYSVGYCESPIHVTFW